MPEEKDVIEVIGEEKVVEEVKPYDWHDDIHPDVKNEKVWESVPDVKTLTKAYADAAKYNVGALKLPAQDAPAEEWAKVWDKLGRPGAPEAYALPKTAPSDVVEKLRPVAHAAGISEKQWATLMDGFDRVAGEMGSARTEQMEATTTELKSEWGAAYDKKLGLVQRMLHTMGGDDVMAEYVRSGAGNHAPTIKMLAKVAEALAEEGLVDDKFDSIPNKEAAMQEIETLTNSPEYLKQSHPNHKSVVDKVTKLFEIVYN